MPILAVLHGARPRKLPKVGKIPYAIFFKNLQEIKTIFENKLEIHSPNYFSWHFIKEGLHACHAYVSWDQIYIRPYIPPTLTHRPFEEANQRIYMSATLGRGGELERTTGISKILRVETPRTYLRVI